MDLFGEEPAEEAPLEADIHTQPFEPEFTHPRLMQKCLGHEKIEDHLQSLFADGRMPHGLVLTGLKGIGKATFAYRLARYVLKYGSIDPNQDDMFGGPPELPKSLDVDPEDKASRLLAAESHPDVMIIEPEKTNIAVADIRRTIPFLRMTASESGWRIVIIDDADTMNRAAQNALLKILEEPPENTLLLLITHRLGALIPTIRSRTQTLHFVPPSKSQFEEILSFGGYALDQEKIETLHMLSEGSVGKAVNYIEDGGLDTLARLLMMFETYPKFDWPAIHVLSEELARAGQDKAYKSFTEFMLWLLKTLLKSKARGVMPENAILRQPAFEVLLRNSSLEEQVEICEKLEEHFRKVEFSNLDKRQGVLQSFMLLAA